MRKSFAAAAALVAIIAIAVPTDAAPRTKAPRQEATIRERSEPPAITVLRKLMKKFFGVETQASPSIPIPDEKN